MKELIHIGGGCLLAAFLASWVASLLLLRGWFRKGEIRRQGTGVDSGISLPVVRFGGLPIFLGVAAGFVVCHHFAVSAGISGPLLSEWVFIIAGAAFLIGFADDLLKLPGSIRLALHIALAICAYNSGMRIDTMSHPVSGDTFELGEFGLILTILWFVALPNLIGLLDSMDGIAGGIGLFLCLTLLVIGVLTGNVLLAALSLVLVGTLSAFLLFNLPPARICLGRGGAFVLGNLIASLSLVTSNKGSVVGPMLVVLVILGLPILESFVTLIRRSLSGLPISGGDQRTLLHKLNSSGISKKGLLLTIYSIFAVFSTLGIAVFILQGDAFPIVGMAFTVFALIGGRLAGIPLSISDARERLREVLGSRSNIRYAHRLVRVLQQDLLRVDSERIFWERFTASLARLNAHPAAVSGRSGSRCSADSCPVTFEISDVDVVHLCLPLRSDREQWERVLHCFIPVIFEAKTRWGKLPERCGFSLRSSSLGESGEKEYFTENDPVVRVTGGAEILEIQKLRKES